MAGLNQEQGGSARLRTGGSAPRLARTGTGNACVGAREATRHPLGVPQPRRTDSRLLRRLARCLRASRLPPGMRPHDFRRTASRAYRRAGVDEQVVMQITGHKTREVFRRYNITTESDLAEAARRVSVSKAAARKGRARDRGK
ncbi:MAG TPA: tyrosine-type recombinase/integrase [Candidatus Dormibacteraeota bacterium]|nr:tyrosine-type recombinase/integrase [Candidatus Dormibacteraeota bacterium]